MAQMLQNQPQALSSDDALTGMDYLNSLYTSPEKEERLRRASVMNQRILALGDAIRNIGNIYNAVNYAPSQKFNDPVSAERARYEKGKALRDAANYRYMTLMQNLRNQRLTAERQKANEKYRSDYLDYLMSTGARKADEFEEKKRSNAATERHREDILTERRENHERMGRSRDYSNQTQRMNAETNEYRTKTPRKVETINAKGEKTTRITSPYNGGNLGLDGTRNGSRGNGGKQKPKNLGLK